MAANTLRRVRRLPSTDGGEVAVYDLGGTGPPLLLAHATGFHAHVWEPLAARLAGRARCVALDFRGHGRSTAPPVPPHWQGFAADVLAVVDGLGLDRPFGVGHSKGGAALLLAEQARPGTFRGLYCYEPIVFPFDPPLGPQPGNPLSVGARRRRAVFASRDEARQAYGAKPPLAALHPDVLRAYVEHGFEDLDDGRVRLRCDPEVEADVYAMGTAHDAFARLGQVTCPVVVAGGGRTDAVTPELVETLAAALPQGRAEVFSSLGHFGPLEDPDVVAASILAAFGLG